jgi:drug/metabolite transporter (DMT)-like permease
MQWKSAERLAFAALLAGAGGIGFAPIFVRLSEVGPSATAFYRVLFALPVLFLIVRFETRSERGTPFQTANYPESRAVETPRQSSLGLMAAAGCLFAGDLAFWHWSIKLTSVANSTLLTNCAPFFVVLGARVIFHERITGSLFLGMAVACAGTALLIGGSPQLAATHLLGDFLALTTAVFYGGYLLTVKYLRRSCSGARILAGSGVVSCALLLLFALLSRENIQISSTGGWMVLIGLALLSHLGGQGLIAYALAHLPAGFSSVGLLLQPVVAAALAWLLLKEPLSASQILGGMIILAGIAVASRSR